LKIKNRGDVLKVTAKWISVVVVFTALYAASVVFLAPISFSIYQVRLADALLPLSMVFGMPSVIGLSLGCIVSNVYGGLGIIDIVGGTVANFVACSLAWYLARRSGLIRRFLGSIIETITITLIVGGYLSLIFEVPLEFGLFGILVGSVVAINFIGFPIEEVIRRSGLLSEEVE
jgi:uncharacterized membrane protein